ncbi:M13 family metallopeptidase [Anthocerotibacter panamensis]|uniref:M13 family metallopeptidase n=1 Tax=Anthocerotibacter panamensis TaxID=2857077 RepID=UPI001C401494|nr:M13 family metallopeptidase [Anthocerotibacter panamensis]
MPKARFALLCTTLALFTPPAPAQTTPGLDTAAIDSTVSPCENFYQYACGGWRAKNPIPGDQASWGRFNELAERNRTLQHELLEKVAKGGPSLPADQRQLGNYYRACMDEAGIEAKGIKALAAEFARIDALKSKADLPQLIAHLHTIGAPVLFNFGSTQDYKDATKVIAEADQGGLGLPDRDFYVQDAPRFVTIRTAYQEHLKHVFSLLGDKPEVAAAHAQTILDFETKLAKASLERVKRREPSNLVHPLKRAELVALTPSFDWNSYLKAIAAPPITGLNVTWPEFFKTIEAQVKTGDLATWKTYLRWHLTRSSAALLPTAFVNENFNFYGKVLNGQKELRTRWKRCVALTDGSLGESLGKLYVEATFGKTGKERTQALINNLEKALREDITNLPWMTAATKREALLKLDAITNKIGFPDQYRDYSAIKVAQGDALGNEERANAFEFKRQLDKIGKPVDKKEWQLTPPTVNAYYDPQNNNINFPAGILQPPFFNKDLDDSVNYGAIGAVIGHELTHGFDDQGRQFDAKGNLRDWWTPEDAKAFEERARCLVDQYSSYTAVDDVKLNGKLTLGENTADNGGLRVAYAALLTALAGKTPAPIDGFTAPQRFFLGWGQVWCQNQTPENARLRVATDPHAPGEFRVNGVVSNVPEFQAAFSCSAKTQMVRENRCRVW